MPLLLLENYVVDRGSIEADVFLCILERGFRKNIEQATKLSVGEISSSKPRITLSISLFQVITLLN